MWISFGNFHVQKTVVSHIFTSNMSICLIASVFQPRPRLLPPDDVQTPVVEDETEEQSARWQWKKPWLFYGYVGDEILPGYYWGLYPVIHQPGFNGKVRNQTNNGLRDHPCKAFPTKYQWAKFGLWTSYITGGSKRFKLPWPRVCSELNPTEVLKFVRMFVISEENVPLKQEQTLAESTWHIHFEYAKPVHVMTQRCPKNLSMRSHLCCVTGGGSFHT